MIQHHIILYNIARMLFALIAALLLFVFVNGKPMTNAYFAFFDESYNTTMNVSKSIPWKMFDRIMVSFTMITEQGNMTNGHPSDHEKILHIMSLYKKARPNGEVFVSIYGDAVDDRFVNASKSDIFAESVMKYLMRYGMDGLDIDWETIGINFYAKDLVNLIKSCKRVFKNKYKISHAIWPDVHYPETVGMLRGLVNEINIMSYGMGIPKVEYLINRYNESGFPYEDIIVGMETESTNENYNTIIGKLELIKKYNLKGLYLYRLDNDDIPIDLDGKQIGPPTFKTTKMLWDALHKKN
jgi:Glycosyl hydrolases family 18